MSETAIPRPIPLWYGAAASLGLAWNIYGLKQFGASLSATSDSLSAQGMTTEQAQIMLTYPAWMTAAFALGVILGTVGCLLLLVRHRLAGPVLAISLVSYLALNTGDAIHGVFAALGAPQVIILTLVAMVAAGLSALARTAKRTGLIPSNRA